MGAKVDSATLSLYGSVNHSKQHNTVVDAGGQQCQDVHNSGQWADVPQDDCCPSQATNESYRMVMLVSFMNE